MESEEFQLAISPPVTGIEWFWIDGQYHRRRKQPLPNAQFMSRSDSHVENGRWLESMAMHRPSQMHRNFLGVHPTQNIFRIRQVLE